MNINDEKLSEAVIDSISISEVCRKLNLTNNGYTFKKIKEKIIELNLDANHFTGGAKRKYDIDKLKRLVLGSTTYSEICRGFDIKTTGGNIRTIKRRIKEHNIDISHFEGKSYTGERRNLTGQKKKPLNEILTTNSNYSRYALKKRLITEELVEYKCSSCSNEGEWLGKSITLQLDHINGVNNDNRLENLRFLCPNCHSQTETYAGKNNK